MLEGAMQIEKNKKNNNYQFCCSSIFHAWTAAAALVLAEIKEDSQNAGGQTESLSKKL